jgi:hypothetical protein
VILLAWGWLGFVNARVTALVREMWAAKKERLVQIEF